MNRRKDRPNVKTTTFELKETWIWLGLAAIYLLLVTWGLLSEGTWDDDCATRFFRVRWALAHPSEFLTLWTRPLFTILYVFPLQLGKDAVVFETALISVMTCYVMYRSARALGLANAFMVIPLLAFQAYYFPVSFNALAEPLGALGLALGLYFCVRRQYLAFAIVGGLLPLARLELSALLVIWAVILLRERKYAHILLLGVPALLWNLGGWIAHGDPLWLLHKVFTGQANIYGHGSFWQYFHRYIFLTGPVIFYLFMVGLLERFYQRRFDFTAISFIVGFLLYVVFSWKLNIGQAAGFMRNLLPLSPYAALLALEGYNAWSGHNETPERRNRFLIWSGVVVLMTLIFFSRTITMHHIVSDQPEYAKLGLILLAVAVFATRSYLLPRAGASLRMFAIQAAFVIGASAGYTLITEPPIGLIPERAVMKQVAEWYARNDIDQRPTYANHIWFFYAGGYDYLGDEFPRVTVANLDAAPVGSIVIWENHYSHRLFGDVQPGYFQNNPNFKTIGQLRAPGTYFVAIVLEKVTPQEPTPGQNVD